MNAVLIPVGYAFCWGVGTTLAKLALAEISAPTLLLIQLSVSVVFLYGVCYWKSERLPLTWRSLKRGVAGIFEPALAYMVGTIGLSLTTVTHASLIGSTEVVLTIIFAAIFLQERLTTSKILLAIASFLGVFLLISDSIKAEGQGNFFGDCLIFIATLFAVGYVLLSKHQISQGTPLELTTSQQLVGLLVTVICFGLLSLLHPDYEISAFGIPPHYWLLAIAAGLMQYALAFLLYLTSLQTLPASQAAFYVGLIPIFGITSAMMLMGEQPNRMQYLGGFFVLGSSYLANRLQQTG
jgi:drug/metabolite transporter (DMT)-like permease